MSPTHSTAGTDVTAQRDVAWRRDLLRAAGLPDDLARAIAASDRHDLNALLDLLHRGCPVATALRLTARHAHEAVSA